MMFHQSILNTDATGIAIEWDRLAPVLIVLGAAVVAVLVEAFVPRKARRPVQIILSILAVVASGLMTLMMALAPSDYISNTVAGVAVNLDPAALYIQLAVATSALLGLLVIADRTVQGEDAFTPQAASVPGSEYEDQARRAGLVQTDVYPLVLFATGGMMLFPVAGDLLTMFVALEVLSLPLYLLSGMARHRRLLSQEASLKYFLLGAFASAFFLFGSAWVFGATGSLNLYVIAGSMTELGMDPILLVGVILICVGLFFKVGAVPFHSWTPDVYQGAPTPITGFMAACTKIAAFGALLRVLYSVVPSLKVDLKPALWTVAILTMVLGTVVGVVQQDVKRMLAYSAIAHAGFILSGLVTFTTDGLTGSLFYLFTYGVATVGGFGVIALIREVDGEGHMRGEATALDQWRGLGRRSPVLAGAFSCFLLTFAGIPLTSGFVGKFAVFSAAFGDGAWALGLTGLACSAVAAFFYFRVIVVMFFSGEPAQPARGGLGIGVRTNGLTQVAITVALALTLVLGVVPGWFLDFTQSLSYFIMP
ncbi:MAG: NADH-quinone oxidoreductase subunit NuoN [Bifidobacteriaceae bacterium]|jgi:NADH-quinone oxidoreductase subunit N|nr:NADH-quinone oxidoreductase subunit NuoN [Bifidobacteriaceae bacterium]